MKNKHDRFNNTKQAETRVFINPQLQFRKKITQKDLFYTVFFDKLLMLAVIGQSQSSCWMVFWHSVVGRKLIFGLHLKLCEIMLSQKYLPLLNSEPNIYLEINHHTVSPVYKSFLSFRHLSNETYIYLHILLLQSWFSEIAFCFHSPDCTKITIIPTLPYSMYNWWYSPSCLRAKLALLLSIYGPIHL